MSTALAAKRTLAGTAMLILSCSSLAQGKAASRVFEPKIPANYEKVMLAAAETDQRFDHNGRTILVARGEDARRVTNSGQKSSPWYLGVAIGRSAFDGGIEATKASLSSIGATSFTVTPHAWDTMWKAHVGYRFTPRVSFEAGYWNFGGPGYGASLTAPAPATFQRTFSAHGSGVDVVLWQPFTDSLSAFGKVGAIRTVAKASAASPGAPYSALSTQSSRTWNAHWGLGITYLISSDFNTRLEYENVRKVGKAAQFGRADINAWTLGLGYSF